MKPSFLRTWVYLIGICLGTQALAGKDSTPFEITSPAFQNHEDIPALYTADGKDISPPLAWENIPKRTKSLVLICDDPDAPSGDWVHWVVYNIPPSLTSLSVESKNMPPSAQVGKNSWGNIGYGGPKPPSGTHHYHFTLYALDKDLKLHDGATKSDLLKAMKGHILAQAKLIGTYTKKSE